MRRRSEILSAAALFLLAACAAPAEAAASKGTLPCGPSYAVGAVVRALPQTANRKRRGRKRRAAAATSSPSSQQKSGAPAAGTQPTAPQTSTHTSGPLSQMTYELPIRKPEAGEARAQGLLTNVECDDRGAVTFNVRAGARTLRLRTANLGSVQFMTFTPEVSGEVTCGTRNNNVVVIYRPATGAKLDGNLIAVQFVPKDFVLKD